MPGRLLNPLSMRTFNELWFRKAPRESREALHSIAAFFHPLDMILGWNRIYGSRGFVQYQFVVPYGEEAFVREALGRFSAANTPSFLAVLKRFETANPGPMSFPMPGWTLALDIPAATPGIAELLDDLDRRVVETGGRVYLAKDSRVDGSLLPAMYPRLGEWRAAQARLDPAGTMQSDLDRRLGLRPRRRTRR
jgi:decaprenylphospho-beta-D-ribofuranose 2-oxidase